MTPRPPRRRPMKQRLCFEIEAQLRKRVRVAAVEAKQSMEAWVADAIREQLQRERTS